MKRKFTILTAALALFALFAIPKGMWGQTASFTPEDFNGQGTSGTGSAISATVNGVTFACDKGYGTTQIRCYSGGTITISSSNTITAVSFTFSGSYTGGMETSYTNLSTTSWTKTLSSQARITDCSVSYTGGDTPHTIYTVTYKANGPEVDDVIVTYNEGTNVTLKPANTFTYEDHTFSEWNTQADGDGDSYIAGDVIEDIEEDMTFYAIWIDNTIPGGETATLNIQTYAQANNWENGVKYTTATVAPVTFTANGGGNTGKYYTSGQDWRFYQGESASITITVPDGYTLASVTPTYSVSNGGVLKNGDATIASGTTVNVSGTSVTFTIGNSGTATNGQVRFTNIDVVYVSDGGTPVPAISADNVEIAYDATAGAISYTINNSVEGGVLTAATTAEWLTLGSVGETVPFTCNVNEGAERSATVILTYTYNSETVTKNVTVTQAANPNMVDNISDITAAGTYAVQGTIVAKSQRGFIVGDGTGYVYYYNKDYTQADYNIGDMVRLAGSVVVYGGVYEFNNTTTVTTATQSNYQVEDPTILSGADMDSRVASTTPAQLSNYVQYVGTLTVDETHYNITGIDGATNAIGSISYPISTDFTSLTGKQVKVTGYYVGISTSTYYNTMIGTVEEVVSTNPSIEASNVGIEYNITSGEIGYTITNPVTGGVLTAATTAQWLTLGTVGNTSIPFTCTVNEDGARSATVTLTYSYGSEQVTKDVTVTQAANPNVPGTEDNPYTVAQARAAIDAATGVTGVYATGIVSRIVTAYNATYGNVTFDMVDEEGSEVTLRAYRCGGDEAANVVVGDVAVVYGDLTKYNNTYEFGEGCTLVSLTHNTQPNISIATATVNLTAEGGDGTIQVTYNNFGDIVADVYFCDVNGDEATYDWLTAEINGDFNIDYVVDANDGAARMAYLKVYALDDQAEEVYSNLVTINQAEYVAPTYAELPFEFTGGKADIEETDGLYQEGLGNDYTGDANATTPLKFDHTGDWLLLQFNERPGTLTFDIKGNTFSGGTFTVQTSEDGETYTDLATYTTLGTTQQEEFTNLGENVRFIKWIYTNKSNGNVGLGNIALAEYVTPHTITLNSYSIVAPAEGKEGSLTVTYTGIETDTGVTIYWFESNGETSASQPDWMSVEINNNGLNVAYQIQENNEDAARTACFKVYGQDENSNDVYSDLVTVIQAAPGIGNYVRITSLDQLTDGSKVIIAARYDEDLTNGYYAMPVRTHNTKPDGVAFTSETSGNDEILPLDIIALEDTYYWTVNVTDDGYTFTNANNQMLGYNTSTSNSTNFAIGGDNTAWTITLETAGENAMVAEYTGFVIRNGNVNTRAFAFNGTAFGAYATTNMTAGGYNFFLDFFVEKEAHSVTQTVQLIAGTNWFSPYVDITLEDLQNALAEATPDKQIIIKSQGANSAYAPRTHRWTTGATFTWDVVKMYQIIMAEACEIVLEDDPINPAEHPITIVGGGTTNWIGYPLTENMTLTEAFADLPPTNGDQLKYQNANSPYARNKWGSGITNLEPGKGYQYISATGSSDRTLTYPTPSKAAKSMVNQLTTETPATEKKFQTNNFKTMQFTPMSQKNATIKKSAILNKMK